MKNQRSGDGQESFQFYQNTLNWKFVISQFFFKKNQD